MTLSPFRLHRQPDPPTPRGGDDADPGRVDQSSPEPPIDEQPAEEVPPAPGPTQGQLLRGHPVQFGSVGLRSAAAYLLLWMLVLLGVEVLVFLVGYLLLARLGVLESVSAAAATVLGDPVPDSGVLPALELPALLPWAVVVGAALALLWLVTSLALVLVHNAICAITGGPSVHVR